VNQQSLLTGSTNDAHHRVVGKSTCPTNAPETATFAVPLEHLSNLFGRHVAMIIQGVKSLVERLLAVGAEIPLAPIGGFTMLMRAGMTT
jgi:hypothetical protein